ASNAQAVLTVAEMGRADAAAIAAGISGETLMEAAGAAVAEELRRRFPPQPTLILCGPGKNRGDGFSPAQRLSEAGWPVRLALLGERGALKGDAAAMAARWKGPIEAVAPALVERARVVVDALFGAGLARPLEGAALATIQTVNARALPCIGVDVPSGV